MRDSLALTQPQAASLAGVLPMGVLAGSLVFGPWCDRYGYRVPFLTALLLIAAGLSGMSASGARMEWLFTCVGAIGMGGGMINGGTSALVSDVSRPEKSGPNMAILGAFYGLGALLMPAILGYFKEVPYTVILRYTAISVAIPLLVMGCVAYPMAKADRGYCFKDALALLKSPILWLFSAVLFFQSALESLTSNWIPIFLQESPVYVYPQAQALYTLSCMMVGLIVCRLLLTYVLMHVSRYTVLWFTFCITAAGMLCLWTGLPAMPATFLIGFGLGATFPVLVSSIGQQFSSLSGTAIGMALVIALAGNTLLNFLMAFIPITLFPVYLLGALLCELILYKAATVKVIKNK